MKQNFFDSTAGMVQYFVRPYDDFILNSLEKLDYNEYLYRLLKEEGYERVVFLEGEETNCIVYAYDKISQLSYENPIDFSTVNIRDVESLNAFYSKCEGKSGKGLKGLEEFDDFSGPNNNKKTVKEWGKRKIKNFNGPAELLTELNSLITPALRAENIKTAIVIDMDIFEGVLKKNPGVASQKSSEFTDMISFNEKNNRGMRNILVYTTSDTTSFFGILNNSLLHTMHPWVSEVLGRMSSNEDRVQNVVKWLKDHDRIVMADSIGEDELANLLLRKKLIEKDERFEQLPISKIYVLAEMLKTHMLQKKEVFATIPYRKPDAFIRQINACLERKETVEELTEKVCQSFSRKINRVNRKSVQVERVTKKVIGYVTISKEEKEAISKKSRETLDNMIGLENVKRTVQEIFATMLIHGKTRGPGHYVFAGSPGTGKTEIARMMGNMLKAQGVLKTGHLVECRRADLVAEVVGGTAIKTREKCKEALEGVLFVDEAYELVNTEAVGEVFSSKFDEEAYTEIMAFMDKERNHMCVIFAGYPYKMQKFITANPGMPSRITKIIEFPDYSESELYEIFLSLAQKDGFKVDEGLEEQIIKRIRKIKVEAGKEFGNARDIRKLLDTCKNNVANRLIYQEGISEEEIEKEKYHITEMDILEESDCDESDSNRLAYDELNELIGLTGVKNQVRSLSNRIKYAVSDKQKASGHYVFVGNPGTGKTIVARLISRIFTSIGVLSTGKTVEVKASDLIAGYVGQTGMKTEERCKEALGGVLFVDEAYMLIENEFGKESLQTIMKFMEDNRINFTVIFAGYKNEMENLMNVNPGFSSRINAVIEFEDYSVNELEQIMKLMARKSGFQLADEFISKSRIVFEQEIRNANREFGNARYVRKFLEKADENRADRLAAMEEKGEIIDSKDERFFLLIEADIPKTEEHMQEGYTQSEKEYSRISSEKIKKLSDAYPVREYSEEELCVETEKAILYVKTDKGAGTAFLISPEGYALTCNHVIEGAKTIEARLRIPGRIGGADTWHRCSVINTKREFDICLLKLEGVDFPYLNIAPVDRSIIRMEEFILSGYPFGERTAKDITTFSGRISSSEQQTDNNGNIRYNINCEAKCGDSGAPIIAKKDGRVIGILLGSMTNSSGKLVEELNYMRPIRYFWEEFLD